MKRKSVVAIVLTAMFASDLMVVLVLTSYPEGMISYWRFDEGTGTTAFDSVGENHGAIYGATWTAGIVGGALNFDGMDDYVIVPDDNSLDLSTGMTIEAWIKSDSTLGPRVIVSKWNDNTWDHSYIFKDHNFGDKLRIELSKSSHNDLVDLEGRTSISLGNWIHVAATFDSNTVKLYFNGTEDGSRSVTGAIRNSVTELLIGAVFTGGGIRENFDGLIDEVAICNRALTAEEISQHYQNGLMGLGYYVERISATIDIDPDTLNLKSKGQWITAYIELPEDYDVGDIDISTVMSNGIIGAKLHPTEIGDYDEDAIPDLMVKFDRASVIDLLSVGEATLTITGEVNGIPFEGSDTIRVIGE